MSRTFDNTYKIVTETLANEEEFLDDNPQGEFEIIVIIRDNAKNVVGKENFSISGTTAAWRKYSDAISIIKDER